MISFRHMGDPVRRVPSFDELYASIQRLPGGMTGEILEVGVLRTMGRPGKRHRRAARMCLESLGRGDANVGGSGWWIEQEVEIQFPAGRLAVPDLAGWRVERVPELPDENPVNVLPDWCCEILSPSTARDDKRLKLPLYAASGVEWTWLVDPVLRLVEIYETVSGLPALRQTAVEDEEQVLLPFEFAIGVGRWWLASPTLSTEVPEG